MSRRRIGLVVGKDFDPPPGRATLKWCRLTVDLSENERISVLISAERASKIDLGDVVRFRIPRREDRPVRSMTRLGSDPRLIPLPEVAVSETSSEGPLPQA